MYAATVCIYHKRLYLYNISQPQELTFCEQRNCINLIHFAVLEFV